MDTPRELALVFSTVAPVFCAALLATSCLTEIRALVTLPSDGGGGATGDGGAMGGGAAMGGGGNPPCPDDMVHASDGASMSFCIDRTEVTRAAYVQFLVAVGGQVPVANQPPQCSTNTDLAFMSDGTCPDFATASQLPVNCVDWCDAHAFCKWADKRLCGALAGGGMTFDDNPVLGEWHFACTGGLMTVYPYGNEADDDACNIPGSAQRAEVATFPACEGGFEGIFDMQGNVAEWIDACESDASDAGCKTRGGHTYGSAAYWKCDNVVESTVRTFPEEREVGFRCCRDTD